MEERYIFDTSDFDKDIKTGTYERWTIMSGTETKEMEYTTSPEWLGFDSGSPYAADHRISRQTLKHQGSPNLKNRKCVLEDIDTSGNLL